jgi:hypothetical protein
MKQTHKTLIDILHKNKVGSLTFKSMSCSKRYVINHPDATEEIILLAKAMDFIEDVENT